jgi:hypothetical protein
MRLTMAAAVAAIIAMPSLSVAEQQPETPVAAFHNLPLLMNLGDQVTLTDDTGRELQGALVDLTPSALSILAEGTRYDLDASGITIIRRRHLDPVSNGVLLGLLTGAGLAAVGVALTAYNPDFATYSGAVAIYGGVGAGFGAIVDVLNTGSEVIYETRGSSGPLSVAPLLSRDRTGVVVSLGF